MNDTALELAIRDWVTNHIVAWDQLRAAFKLAIEEGKSGPPDQEIMENAVRQSMGPPEGRVERAIDEFADVQPRIELEETRLVPFQLSDEPHNVTFAILDEQGKDRQFRVRVNGRDELVEVSMDVRARFIVQDHVFQGYLIEWNADTGEYGPPLTHPAFSHDTPRTGLYVRDRRRRFDELRPWQAITTLAAFRQALLTDAIEVSENKAGAADRLLNSIQTITLPRTHPERTPQGTPLLIPARTQTLVEFWYHHNKYFEEEDKHATYVTLDPEQHSEHVLQLLPINEHYENWRGHVLYIYNAQRDAYELRYVWWGFQQY